MLETLKKLLGEYTDVKPEDITENSDFILDLHIDSVDMVALVMAAEDTFHIQIDDEALGNMRTVGEILKYLEK